jgi:hypothetical protein
MEVVLVAEYTNGENLIGLSQIVYAVDLFHEALSMAGLKSSAIGHRLYCDKYQYEKIKRPFIIQTVNASTYYGPGL